MTIERDTDNDTITIISTIYRGHEITQDDGLCPFTGMKSSCARKPASRTRSHGSTRTKMRLASATGARSKPS